MPLFRQFTKVEAKTLKKMVADKSKRKEPEKLAEAVTEVAKEPNRDYKKAANWEKSKYKQFNVKIDKDVGEAFAIALKRNNDTLISWFTRCMETYMKDDKAVHS